MNFVYVHSHDTGRHVQPYGAPVATPNIQRVADEGVLYRQAFSGAPVCSPSRAALLTGEPGMLGLAHRGWRLRDPHRHIAHTLKAAGYTSAMIGEQHVSPDPAEVGYDAILDGPVAETAAAWLRRTSRRTPFFLSVGFTETHRPFPAVDAEAPAPAHLPDVPEIRRDMAGFAASARALDDGVGTVLDAVGEDTLVILTTDHGIAFPGAKATLTDRGIGVMLILRGPGFEARVCDELVSQLDLYPTLCELAEIPVPSWARGRSLLSEPPSDAVFAEMTFHAAYEPQRAVRTTRYKYIRRYADGLVLANLDDSPTKDYLLAHGLLAEPAREQLYDLAADPGETRPLTDGPVLGEMRARLDEWMEATDDPLLHGPVAPPAGAVLNHPWQRSPDEPATVVS